MTKSYTVDVLTSDLDAALLGQLRAQNRRICQPLLVRRLLVCCAVVTIASLITGCGGGDDVEFDSAREVSEAIGCDDLIDPAEAVLEDGEPEPADTVTCGFEAPTFEVRHYDSEDAADKALAAMQAFCGYRAVGDTWIVIVDTEDRAQELADELEAAAVELDGCE